MEYCGEYRVTILLLYGEVVAHRILGFHCTTTFDDSSFKKHTLGKRGLAATRTAKQRDVLDFICLIYSHIKKI